MELVWKPVNSKMRPPISCRDYYDVGEKHAMRFPTMPSIKSINEQALQTILSRVFIAILLTRSIGDPIFSSFETSIGIGAAINAIMIGIAFLLVLARLPESMPAGVFSIWMPLLLVALVSTLRSPDFITASRMFLLYLSYWASFIIPLFIFKSREDIFRFMLIIFASSIIPSLYACVNILSGLSNIDEFRLQSTFMHPNIYAFYLVLLLCLALYVKSSQVIIWPIWFRRILTYYIPVLFIFIALTKARNAYLATGVMFIYYALYFDRRFLFAIILVPLLFLFDSSITDRILELSRSEEIEDLRILNEEVTLNSYAWRLLLWSSAMPLIEAEPWLGHGLESFRYLSPTFFPLDLDGFPHGGTDAHNFYLEVLFEMGLVGILALAWLFGTLAWTIAKGLASDRRGTCIIFGALATFLLQSYSDNTAHYLSFIWYFWFAMGTVCAWVQFENSARNVNRQ